MTKQIIFLLTASMLSIGILTGCSGTSDTAQTDNNQAVTQTDEQGASSVNSDDASGSSVNTVIGTDKTSSDDGGTTAANSSDGYLSEEEASAIALAQVDGATENDLRIKRDTDDGKNIYEISILYDNIEYDFEIDAQTGTILEQSSEMEEDNWINSQNSSNYISEDEAKNIALGQVDGASESDLRIHKDNDDGKDIYEGSIVYNDMEYEFEIDAATGSIIDWSSESVYDD